MTYSANDHPVDTLSLVLEVLDEAHDQTDDRQLINRIKRLKKRTSEVRRLAREIHGESPTEMLMARNDTEQLIKDAITTSDDDV